MKEEISEYIKYLDSFKDVKKPPMPIFSTSAYTDNEYISVIDSIMKDYENIDDFEISLKYLKGE